MRRTSVSSLWTATLLVAAALLSPFVSTNVNASLVPELPLLGIDSIPPTEPAIVGWNDLDLTVIVPGSPAIEFSASPVTVPGFPDWTGIVGSPLGSIVLVPLTPGSGEVLMAFLDSGVSVPLDWDHLAGAFVGTDGTVGAIVRHSPLSPADDQGPPAGGPCVDVQVSAVPQAPGVSGIRISVVHPAECAIRFQQFFRQSITYVCTSGGPFGVPCPIGPDGQAEDGLRGSGNNGEPAVADLSRTYSDSNGIEYPGTPAGDYPIDPPQPIAGSSPASSTTSMEDYPRIDAEKLKNYIEGRTGDTVTELRMDIFYTTYVVMTCIPLAPVIVARIEWSAHRRYTFPGGAATGEVGGGCPTPSPERGFPNTTPSINVTPGQVMDPGHAAILTDFRAGRYGGG